MAADASRPNRLQVVTSVANPADGSVQEAPPLRHGNVGILPGVWDKVRHEVVWVGSLLFIFISEVRGYTCEMGLDSTALLH